MRWCENSHNAGWNLKYTGLAALMSHAQHVPKVVAFSFNPGHRTTAYNVIALLGSTLLVHTVPPVLDIMHPAEWLFLFWPTAIHTPLAYATECHSHTTGAARTVHVMPSELVRTPLPLPLLVDTATHNPLPCATDFKEQPSVPYTLQLVPWGDVWLVQETPSGPIFGSVPHKTV